MGSGATEESGVNYSPICDDKGRFLPWVRKLAKKSGAYVIREAEGIIFQTVLYVGESHTGSLKKTLIRHFQRWKGETAGRVYNRKKVVVAVVSCTAERAIEIQNLLIERLQPRDNIAGLDGETLPEKPF